MHVEPGINSARYPEVSVLCNDNFKLPGSGQRNTPVVDRQGCLLLIEMLDEVAGDTYRAGAAILHCLLTRWQRVIPHSSRARLV